MVQPSQSHMRKDATRGYGASSAVWRSLPESQMRAILVVVANIPPNTLFPSCVMHSCVPRTCRSPRNVLVSAITYS
jgi:hypothetical protein